MDRPFTERLDGKEGESNGSAVKGTAEKSRCHFTRKPSSNGNETDLTAIPMHNFSDGEESRDLEIIALHPESGQLGDDETMTASYFIESKSFLLFEEIKCITLN